LNPRLDHFEQAITPNTKAAIVLHYGGYPGHVAEISTLAADRSLPLIEDAAIALGSFIGDKACGTLGEIGCWSFDSMKTLATGDGGMVWARRPQVLDRIRNATRLGLESSGFHRRTSSERWWELEPAIAGRWAPMNDLTSALGLAQLERLPGFLDRRAQIAAAYDAGLSDSSWLRTPPAASERTARTFYWIQTAPAIRDALARRLLERDIYTSFRYWPLHKTQMYRSSGSFPGADAAAASTLLLPLHQELSEGDVDRVIETVRSFSQGLNK
jgi:aminotransferase